MELDDLDACSDEDGVRERTDPWTLADHTILREVALACVQGMHPISEIDGLFYAGIPGPLYWDLLSALDRMVPRPGPGRPFAGARR